MDVHDAARVEFPPCRRCGEGDLVPLSDFGAQGAEVLYKAWVCTNPSCGFNLKIRNGEVFVDEPVIDGSAGHGGPRPKGPAPLPPTEGAGRGRARGRAARP
jgi:hypothetical protein